LADVVGVHQNVVEDQDLRFVGGEFLGDGETGQRNVIRALDTEPDGQARLRSAFFRVVWIAAKPGYGRRRLGTASWVRAIELIGQESIQ